MFQQLMKIRQRCLRSVILQNAHRTINPNTTHTIGYPSSPVTMPSASFFLPRSAASVMPAVTRTAQPSTPRPLPAAVTKPAATPSAVVLAWDNVLFPTMWMVECMGLRSTNTKTLDETKRVCFNNPFVVQALTAIEQQVLDLLALATTKAPVFILSDYTSATIDAVCTAFFPRLKACLAKANDRVHIMATATTVAAADREAWKLNVLQRICSASMDHQRTRSVVQATSSFKVLTVSADELDARVAGRVQAMVAGVGTVQSLTLPAAMANGKPLSLVDFHKQLQSITTALASQF